MLNPKKDIVDIVLNIMDSGPRPMKDLKPTQKVRNGAEQFWDEHQAEYEARGASNNSGVNKVEQHNMAYPKLRDELRKRRSLREVKPLNAKINTSHLQYFDPKCSACIRLRYLNKLQNMNIQPRCRKLSQPKRVSNKRNSNSRVEKYKSKRNSKISSSITRMYRQCLSVPISDKKVGADRRYYSKFNSKSFQNCPRTECYSRLSRRDSQSQCSKVNLSEKSNSVNTFRNPDTSVPSLSSYNSFGSMDQEPMLPMEP